MDQQHDPDAMKIVYKYMAVSAGAALVPFAGADVAVLAGIHVALIKRLCEHYKVDFSEHTARNILIAVLGSVVPGTLGSDRGTQDSAPAAADRPRRRVGPDVGLVRGVFLRDRAAVHPPLRVGGHAPQLRRAPAPRIFRYLFATPSPSLEPTP